jgi:hypothetical protein
MDGTPTMSIEKPGNFVPSYWCLGFSRFEVMVSPLVIIIDS